MIEKLSENCRNRTLNQPEKRTFKSFGLEGFNDIKVMEPGIQYYINLMRGNQPFVFIKRTHGFWDRLADLVSVEPHLKKTSVNFKNGKWLKNAIYSFLGMNREGAKEVNLLSHAITVLEEKSPYKYFWKDSFFEDLLHDLQNFHQVDNYFEALSFRGFMRDGLHTEKLDARHGKDELREGLLAFCPRQPIWHDALVWKDAVFSGDLLDVFDVLKDFRVILVGPSHFENFDEIFEFKGYHHVSIHPAEAIKDRDEILESVAEMLKEANDNPTVCLFQSGSLAYWLIYRLFEKFPSTFYLDMGRVLDIWFPEVVSTQPWFIENRELIIKKMKLEGLYK